MKKYKELIKRNIKKCIHDSCQKCSVTGRKKDGTQCVHYISCNCEKCRVNY